MREVLDWLMYVKSYYDSLLFIEVNDIEGVCFFLNYCYIVFF